MLQCQDTTVTRTPAAAEGDAGGGEDSRAAMRVGEQKPTHLSSCVMYLLGGSRAAAPTCVAAAGMAGAVALHTRLPHGFTGLLHGGSSTVRHHLGISALPNTLQQCVTDGLHGGNSGCGCGLGIMIARSSCQLQQMQAKAERLSAPTPSSPTLKKRSCSSHRARGNNSVTPAKQNRKLVSEDVLHPARLCPRVVLVQRSSYSKPRDGGRLAPRLPAVSAAWCHVASAAAVSPMVKQSHGTTYEGTTR
jgi:hypothetical protein